MKKYLFLSLIAFTITNVHAQWNKITVSNDVPSNVNTRIINGNPWIAYCDSATLGKLHLSRWNGKIFYTEIIDNQGGTKNLFGGKDKNDNYSIIYNAGISNDVLKYISLKDSVIETIPSSNTIGSVKQITVRYTKTNQPFVTYIKGSALYLDTLNGSSWVLSDTIEKSNVLTNQLRLDTKDVPFVAYYYENGTDRKIIYAKKNGLTWNKAVIANIKSIGISPKVFTAFSPDGIECVVFPDNDSIRYYKNNGATWVLYSKYYIGTLKKGSVQNYGVDKKNNLLLTAVYNNDTLHYITYDGINWKSESVAAIDINNYFAHA